MLKTFSLSRNEKLKKNLGIKKNLSSLTATKSTLNFSNSQYKDTNNKSHISLFIENNPYHYRLPSNKNKKINIKNYSERNYFNKRLMDSIENFARNSKFNSENYDSHVSELMTKYKYSNPNVENKIISNYELTRTKMKFYNEKKKTIQNFLKKSKSVFKYKMNDSKFDENDLEKMSIINIKNLEYKDPIDSLGLLLRNKIVHDKILLNYQDRQVQDYGKKINVFKNIIKNDILSKKIKITSIIPSMLGNDNLFHSTHSGYHSNNNRIISLSENKQYNKTSKYSNKIVEKVNYFEMSDFIKGSVYLLCNFFRPPNFLPESREEFCMDYDPITNNVYLFSGNSSNINTHQLLKYNLLDNIWTNIESDFTPEARRGHTGVLYKNKFYIFGGKYLNSNYLAKLEIFDFNTNSWLTNSYNYFLFKLRRNHIACLIGSQMLIHGGIDEDGQILDDTYLLNLNNNNNNNFVWSKASIMPILIPPKLAYHSCCLVITSDILYSNKFNIYRIPNSFIAKKLNSHIREMGMYVFGGKNKTISNDMWLLKIGKKPLEWEKILTLGTPPSPRYLCSMNFFEKGNFIVIHGGKTKINEESFALNDTYLFELFRYQWLKVDYGDKEYLVKKRCSHCSIICENQIFIFGGINDIGFNGSKFFVIDLDTNKAKDHLIKLGKLKI